MQNRDRVRDLVVRMLLVLASALSFLLVASAVPDFLRLGFDRPVSQQLIISSLLLTVFSTLCAAGVVLLLVLKSWKRKGARSLAIFLAYVTAAWAGHLWGMEFSIDETGNLDATATNSSVLVQALILATLPLASAAFLRLSATFPQVLPFAFPAGQKPGWVFRTRKWLNKPAVVWGFTWSLVGLQVILWYLLGSYGNGSVAEAPGWLALPWVIVCLMIPGLFMVISTLLGLRNFLDGYRSSQKEARKQLLWLLVGIVISTLLFLIPLVSMPVLASDASHFGLRNIVLVSFSLTPTVLVLSILMGIFYTGNIDPALVLKRSTLIGIGTTLWIFLYAALESILAEWLQVQLGLPGAIASGLVAILTAGMALLLRKLFSPLYAKLGHVIVEPEQAR